MNAYDFDKTIYNGDSSVDFYCFCLRRHPRILKFLPTQLRAFFGYRTGKINKTQMKERFYAYFTCLEDIDSETEAFWNKKIAKIKNWYLKDKQEDDIIISASPEFLLRPACERLGILCLIASKVDKKSGKYNGQNCYGEEKIKRFAALYGEKRPKRFYSDSYSDDPMAKISDTAYLVKKNKILPWHRG